jgi:hypothetical protein
VVTLHAVRAFVRNLRQTEYDSSISDKKNLCSTRLLIFKRAILTSCQEERSMLVEDVAPASIIDGQGPYAERQKGDTEGQSDVPKEAYDA